MDNPIPGQPTSSQPARTNEVMPAVAMGHIDLGETPVYLIRERKVILDEDVARLYEVESRVLIRAVRREIERFPVDFLFKLTLDEFRTLQRQASTPAYMGRNKSAPYAFTEAGLIMAAQVLNSAKAIQMNLEIVRNFVRLSKLCGQDVDVSDKIEHLELKYDQQFQKLFKAIETMQSGIRPPLERQIGFRVK